MLIEWYQTHKRSLPWRDTRDPYKIWISEIILQQTQVVQGLDYYHRFVKHFPDVKRLAEASEDEVMKLWQGLGYYSRARNLHAAAKYVMTECDGVFPDTHQGIMVLKGVGAYTAAAIASFAYRLPHAVVDGNVYRVLSRVFGVFTPIDSNPAKKEFALLADELLDRNEPDTFNQAIMEFGALQCKPKATDCSVCPFIGECVACKAGCVGNLPVKARKTKKRNRYLNFIHIKDGDHTFIHKRIGKDIWQNLYQLPLIETDKSSSVTSLQALEQWTKFVGTGKHQVVDFSEEIIHQLSHQKIHGRFLQLEVEGFNPDESWLKVHVDDLEQYALPRLIEAYFDQI